mmetsp:Transcript_25352/g.58950  ORF Transcript_25352/g.58950 Transcript_25352/m.58950 type:complete len:219 (-) Transcript_25352:44-700(-)
MTDVSPLSSRDRLRSGILQRPSHLSRRLGLKISLVLAVLMGFEFAFLPGRGPMEQTRRVAASRLLLGIASGPLLASSNLRPAVAEPGFVPQTGTSVWKGKTFIDALPSPEQMERARRRVVPNIQTQYKFLKTTGRIPTLWVRNNLDLVVLQMRVWNAVQRKGDAPDPTVKLLEDFCNDFEEAARSQRYTAAMEQFDGWLKALPDDAPAGNGKIPMGDV